MASANAQLCESLIGPANKIQAILSGGFLSVDRSHEVSAFMAKNQTTEQVIIFPCAGLLPTVHEHLNLIEGFFVNDGLMCPRHNNPVFFWLLHTNLRFITDLSGTTLNHIPYIKFVVQDVGNIFCVPQSAIWARIGDSQIGVDSG